MTALTFATALEQFNAEFAPVRIPPIADSFIDASLHDWELDRADFYEAVNAHATPDELCEWLENMSEPRLTHYTDLTDEICVRLSILDDDHFGPLSAHLWATNAEFRNEFAHENLNYILEQLDKQRAERGRLSNRQEDCE